MRETLEKIYGITVQDFLDYIERHPELKDKKLSCRDEFGETGYAKLISFSENCVMIDVY